MLKRRLFSLRNLLIVKMLCLVLYFCVLGGYGLPAHRPNRQIDSLESLLLLPQNADNPAIYNRLAFLYQNINLEQSLQYASQAYDLAEKQGDKKAQLEAIIQKGEYYLSKRNSQEAYPLFQRAYVIAGATHDSLHMGIAKGKMGIALYIEFKYASAATYLQDALKLLKLYPNADVHRANFMNTLSYVFSNQGRYSHAIEYAKDALEIRQRIDPTGEMTARSLNTLGEFYLLQGNLRKAMEYFNSSLNINRKNDNKRGIAIMLTNIGQVYMLEGNYQKAINNLLFALEIKYSIKAPPREVAMTQILLGKAHLAENRPEKACPYIKQALETFTQVGDKPQTSKAHSLQAKYFAAMGHFADAIREHKKAVAIAEETGQIPLIITAYEELAQTYLLMDDAKNFVKYYKRYKAGKDSLDKELKSMDFVLMQEELDRRKQEEQELQAKIKEAQKRKEQEQAERARNLFILLFVIAFFVVLTFGYLLKMRMDDQKRLQKQNEIISRQNKELEAQKKELQELISAKDKLFSIVAHDIRSPLAGLSTMLELLGKRQINLNEEETQDALQQINKSLANVYQLLNNLLDWARLQTGAFTFEPASIPVLPIVRKTIDLFEPQLAAKNVAVINRIEESTVVFADKNMLEFILRNLLSNAVKFTFPDKNLVLESEKDGSFLYIRVKDNGIGLTQEEAERIFNLPVSKLGTKGERGAGIALSICTEFMEKHGGRIWASPNPEGGSIFHLQFPIPGA